MPTGLFTRRRKITIAIAFVLAWQAAWFTDSSYSSEHSITVFSARAQTDEQGDLSFIPLETSSSPDYYLGKIQLNVVMEFGGWPFSSTLLRANTELMPERHWHFSMDYAPLRQTILASDDQHAIDVIKGVYPQTGPRILGWIGNVAVWWILSYIGIVLTLTFARGTDRATHIPKELVQQNRAEQGLCPHCAYDLRAIEENDLCPECGKKPTDLAVSEAKKNPIADKETNKDDAAKVSCE